MIASCAYSTHYTIMIMNYDDDKKILFLSRIPMSSYSEPSQLACFTVGFTLYTFFIFISLLTSCIWIKPWIPVLQFDKNSFNLIIVHTNL